MLALNVADPAAARANATPVKCHAEQYDDVHRDADRNAQYDDKDATKKALKSVANKQSK
jgi:hypothetical protein